MNGLLLLIPMALLLGGLALGAFMWALRSGQYEDLEGAGQRILDDGDARRVPAKAGPTGEPGSGRERR